MSTTIKRNIPARDSGMMRRKSSERFGMRDDRARSSESIPVNDLPRPDPRARRGQPNVDIEAENSMSLG